ncbi:uncharacterized protein LOC133737577 [Rosa rugosa]|uniref:uncharacterized protein LOC133737577 n=1 Tax=Rosa rugosa TaxID=74645 RepID=UPI002B40C2B3|nr:uncharacterized protein LOC133737577 [Rosa rugosa]
MRILCWNCQGIGNPRTVQGLKGLMSLNVPSIVFLSETKCTAAEMVDVRRQLGLSHVFSVSCIFKQKKKGTGYSRSGGLCLLWTDDVEVSLSSYSLHHIDVVIGMSDVANSWRFTGVYGYPKVEDRHLTWDLLKSLGQQSSSPWDLASLGEELEVEVQSNAEIMQKRKKRKKRRTRRFRFEELWLRDVECARIVEEGWDRGIGSDPFTKVCSKIDCTRRALMEWSQLKFGELKRRIEDVRGRLAVFFDSAVYEPLDNVRVELESELNDLLEREQVFWKQRAKVFWLTDGDINTKFFHQRASNRRRKNLIRGLFDEDNKWCTEDEDIENIVLSYFRGLFTSSSPIGFERISDVIPRLVTDELNVELTKPISLDEVHRALRQMHPSKAPGPDGFSPSFYQHFWAVVGPDVLEAVRGFIGCEQRTRLINHTHVTLIPKVKDLELVTQLRPISLCNVIYKVGSKVLANRLKPLLDNIISPFQSAFVPGRLISDNSLVAFEISHFLKRRRRGNVGYGALKLDMSKAYDRVEWSFLRYVLLGFGFSIVWTQWIMCCVETVSYSFMINGEPRGHLIPSRGLRQGDSISPYLFLICAEVLTRLIFRAESEDLLHGIQICTGAPCISHLFFADDSFIFFKADLEDTLVLKDILEVYEGLSGQRVNYQKSSIAFSKNVCSDMQDQIALLLHVERVEKHDKYLGLPIEIGFSKTEAFSFLNERIKKRTKGWREKMLSAAGKELLIKAVAQSIPTYVMSCFEVPIHLCNEMHSLMAKFWWGSIEEDKKIHWLSWDRLCCSKAEGGLGFRNMHHFNLALLAKQGWRLIQNPDSLIARLLKARYYPNTDFMQASIAGDVSFTWRSIVKGQEVLRRGLRYQVGNGKTIRVWEDPWIPLPYSFIPYSSPMDGLEDMLVEDLIDQEEKEWAISFMNEIFYPEEVGIIASIPLSVREPNDKWMWHFSKNGVYSVRSGYHVFSCTENISHRASSSGGSGSETEKYWKSLWKARLPPKVRTFVWRLHRGIVPTRAALAKKYVPVDTRCAFCDSFMEDDLHLFKNCKVVEEFWLSGPLAIKVRTHHAMNVSAWVMHVCELLPNHQRELFYMLLWALWVERNATVWRGSTFRPLSTAAWASKLLSDYQEVHPTHGKTKIRKRTKWQLPPSGRLKLNTDGAYHGSTGQGGIGAVLRDEFGVCLAAIARPFSHVSSAFQMELEAMRAGLLLIIHQGMDGVDIETDCAAVVTALQGNMEDLSEVGCIVEDCKDYMRAIPSCNLRSIYREANGVAHRLAHLASVDYLDDYWLDETPVIIQDVLYEDSCISTREAKTDANMQFNQ